MATTKSAKKSIKTTERRRQRNVAVKSRMKTYVKLAVEALESKDPELAKPAVTRAVSEIDRAAAKGVIHKNSAGRKKSSLQRRAAAL